jgi:ribonuclease P protein component
LTRIFSGFFPLKNRAGQTNPPRRATFPVRARLLKPTEFKRVFRDSIASSDRCFKVLARRNEGNCSRLGMAVSRQVDRHAVGRNRIKRVIRESFRQSFGQSFGAVIEENSPGIDFVVLPRREAATICNHQLFQSLQAHWSCLKQETGFKQESG